MMGGMDLDDGDAAESPPSGRRRRAQDALEIVEDIDRARSLLLDHDVADPDAAYEEMRAEVDRTLRRASLRVAELAAE